MGGVKSWLVVDQSDRETAYVLPRSSDRVMRLIQSSADIMWRFIEFQFISRAGINALGPRR